MQMQMQSLSFSLSLSPSLSLCPHRKKTMFALPLIYVSMVSLVKPHPFPQTIPLLFLIPPEKSFQPLSMRKKNGSTPRVGCNYMLTLHLGGCFISFGRNNLDLNNKWLCNSTFLPESPEFCYEDYEVSLIPPILRSPTPSLFTLSFHYACSFFPFLSALASCPVFYPHSLVSLRGLVDHRMRKRF